MGYPTVEWAIGTAYDFFVSLKAIHNPSHFGIRPAWTAGMRARLPADKREILELSQQLFDTPVHVIHALPEPRDAASLLWYLRQVPVEERLALLTFRHDSPEPEEVEMLKRVATEGKWGREDQKMLKKSHLRFSSCDSNCTFSEDQARGLLECWSRPEVFGEAYLDGLQAYQEVFYGEEEKRIRPALEEVLEQAMELAERMPLVDLIETLSQGVRMPALIQRAEQLILVPSFWLSPLIHFEMLDATRELILFGARPKASSIVPGEMVPDMLVRGLKALSDSTRLRILQHLTDKPMTPAQLARHLRLRGPTITHHLKILRLAGLVRLTKDSQSDSKCYSARDNAVPSVYQVLQMFLTRGRGSDT